MQSWGHILVISSYTQLCLEGVPKQVEPSCEAHPMSQEEATQVLEVDWRNFGGNFSNGLGS